MAIQFSKEYEQIQDYFSEKFNDSDFSLSNENATETIQDKLKRIMLRNGTRKQRKKMMKMIKKSLTSSNRDGGAADIEMKKPRQGRGKTDYLR